MVRVFPAGEPKETRERLIFLGAAGEGLEEFLRDLRSLVVAVPTGLGSGAEKQVSRLGPFLGAKGIPNIRAGSHFLFSVSSNAPIDALSADSPEAATILKPVSIAVRNYFTLSYKVPVFERCLDLSGPPLLMGIVNVTPDSFSDGGAYRSAGEAVDRGLAMATEGAAILDVGGESTRPGSKPVPIEEELRRVIPVVLGLSGKTGALVSVDTTKAAVAREAIAAGAGIVNDTSALADDPGMASVVRDTGCAVVLMHRRGTPATMQQAPHYESLFDELLGELSDRIEAAAAEGIVRERILVDPGIGFGKRQADNLSLLRHLPELRVLGRPIVFGPSRKAFIGALTGSPAPQRQFGTAAAITAAVLSGAHILRIHDVKEMREVVQVAAAIRGAGQC